MSRYNYSCTPPQKEEIEQAREAAISSLWYRRSTRAGVCAICPTCSRSRCRCARQRWESKLTEEQIFQEMKKMDTKRDIEQKVADFREKLENE